ncbi:MAG: hypothetical protein IPK34_15175 [Ramlibacter sp.]|jgi:hypothetical protein|nr:hypothetical protein [Ramlibacter sp.]
MTSRAILALLLVLHTAASAISIRDLRRLQASDELVGENYVHYYLIGAMEGSREAHAHAVRAGARPQICVGDRRLEPRMALGIYQAELQRNAELYELDMPVELVMYNALVNTYPCNR